MFLDLGDDFFLSLLERRGLIRTWIEVGDLSFFTARCLCVCGGGSCGGGGRK